MHSSIQSSVSSSLSTTTALVVIDPRVDSPEQLVAGLRSGSQAVVLDLTQDGIAQITQALAGGHYGSLHLVAHGTPGRLELGSGLLSLATLPQYRQQLLEWGVAEILVYGCEVAAQPQMLQVLHQLTGATVAGSAMAVGQGNWRLEWRTGEIRAESVFTSKFKAFYQGTFISEPQLVKDINIGSDASNPFFLKALGDTLIFVADDGENGRELWVKDGSAPASTRMLQDINFGSDSSNPNSFTLLGDKLIFHAESDTHGNELWVTQGTAATTLMLKDINPGTYITGEPRNSNVSYIATLGDSLIFGAYNNTYGYELWATNGTPATTQLLKDIYPGTTVIGPNNSLSQFTQSASAVLGNQLIFQATDGDNQGPNLWITDGTSFGTQLLSALGTQNSSARSLTTLGDKVIFSNYTTGGSSAFDRGLWVTDGTTAGTQELVDVNLLSNPESLTVLGNKIVFSANHSTYGNELWVTDGTTAGTQLLKDINIGSSSPDSFVVLGDKIIFAANVTSNNSRRELWVTDGGTSIN